MPAPTSIIDHVVTSGAGLVFGGDGRLLPGLASGNKGPAPPNPGAPAAPAGEPDDVRAAVSSSTLKPAGASVGRPSPRAVGVSAVHGTAAALLAVATGVVTRWTAGRGFIAARTFWAAGTITAPVDPAQMHIRSFAAAGVTIVHPDIKS
jgi:hypothetical protein